MPITLDATVGGASANAFITLVEAQAYMDGRLNGDLWAAASTDSQNRAIVEATRELSSRAFVGERSTTTQALAWPRAWAVDPDIRWGGNPYFSSTIIPQRVKDGTAELALQFIKAGTADIASNDPNAFVIEKTVGPLTTRYAEPYQRPLGLGRYPSVLRYVAPLFAGTSSSADVIRG